MLDFRLRFLSFAQVLDSIIETPGVQGSHPQGVQILSLPWRGTGAAEPLLAQPQVHARSFRYSFYSGRCQFFEYLLGLFVVLFMESACAELEILDRRLKQRLKLPRLSYMSTH
jgi:hypothetical protein